MSNKNISQAIVVEGRDDSAAIRRALDAFTIETHGYGIRESTWIQIEKAYNERGIIIFTDPDYSGEQIRKKVAARFPKAKHAYLSKNKATKNGNIGVENASPFDIIEALLNSHEPSNDNRKEISSCSSSINGTNDSKCVVSQIQHEYGCSDSFFYTLETLDKYGLIGSDGSKERREKLGENLSIGYANAKTMVRKLNEYKIPVEEFKKAIGKI